MRTTSEIMSYIESRCSWLTQDARLIANGVMELKQRRDFPTLVEEGFDLAERELIEALALVRKARKTYQAKPAERDPYVVGDQHVA